MIINDEYMTSEDEYFYDKQQKEPDDQSQPEAEVCDVSLYV